ncbi:50S ribosomal protein L7 [Lactobacillus delbrueckii subsp. indicus]|nr:50S ribosomal protein L7 [Lactobacillus delbrueckii subsp. indicus]KNE30508.1 50S ribosomal protein L7 [Lactobacillus delbrueckii subsp. indicus]
MNNRKKALNLLGLATRAGKTVSGTDIVLAKLKKGKLKCIIIANDLAENSRGEIEAALKVHPTPLVDVFTEAELSQAVGKKRKVLALTDRGFAKTLLDKIKEGV